MKKIIFIFFVILLFTASYTSVEAQYNKPGDSDKLDCPAGQVCLKNPLGINVTPQIFIGRIIKAILGIVGSLALLMFIYGGFNWMTAAGNAEKVEKGKSILVWAVIG